MRLGSIRELSGLKPVLKDPHSQGPDPVYWVFSKIDAVPWDNMTVIAPGNFNGEFPKTFGHYHPKDAPDETYQLVSGDGIFMMQKKHLQNDQWVEDMVDEVLLIKTSPGDKILIKPEWGHAWSNIGTSPLITFDNWVYGHTPSDYEVIEKLKGMAYYLVERDGKPQAIPNPNYKDLPTPKWITAQELNTF